MKPSGTRSGASVTTSRPQRGATSKLAAQYNFASPLVSISDKLDFRSQIVPPNVEIGAKLR
jgi:hypothetical protein